LPNVTYGLDVMAYIAYQRNGEQKQFKEIGEQLRTEYQVEICESEVGRLYRKIEALLMGNQAAIHQEVAAAAEANGQLIMAVDGLQPDGGGPKLYLLHEVLSDTLISVALSEQANEVNLTDWLAPYREWRGVVKATLSDKEKALVAALETTWPGAVHQLCQLHFVKDLSEPVHEADRQLQQVIREAMGQLPAVPVPPQEEEEEEEGDTPPPADDAPGHKEEAPSPRQLSGALMQAIDIISGVDLETLDTLPPEEWTCRLSGTASTPQSEPQVGSTSEGTVQPVGPSSAEPADQSVDEATPSAYLSALETVAWLSHTLLAQVPASARPLVEATPDEAAVTYWEHTRCRRAIQDARHLGSRKPFHCGGLRGYDQLQAIADHLAARQRDQGLDAYLSKLHERVQRALAQARPLADEVRQAKEWLVRVERLLAETPQTEGAQPPSAIQRQRMRALLAECERQVPVPPTVQALRRTWRRMLDGWEADLYHCYDIEGLPRSNLGIEALLGQARRQQRRRRGQADTSPLAVTGQGYLRAMSAGQAALLEMFCQVPTWVYRLALRCVEAMEAGVRWPRQLHRDTARALQQFQAQAEVLRQRVPVVNSPP
jgi:hypothetical protein